LFKPILAAGANSAIECASLLRDSFSAAGRDLAGCRTTLRREPIV
jgi:hypothetical protein